MDKSTSNLTPIRVLVFGATGTGKTSLCNELTGRSRPVDSGAQGVTAKSHRFAPFASNGRMIELVDTVGLHEASSGTVPAEQAVIQLVDLLEKAREGFNLLIHVVRASRITKEQEEDFQFFFDKLTQRQIPIILALTGCENEEPMGAWVEANHQAFARFPYKEIVPTCFAKGGVLESHFAPLRSQSRTSILSSIDRHSLPESCRLYGKGTLSTFDQALTRIWNGFVDLAGLPDTYRRQVNETAYSLMRRLGVSDAVARLAIKHIPDLVEELASKAPYPGAGKIARKISETVLKKIFPKKGSGAKS